MTAARERASWTDTPLTADGVGLKPNEAHVVSGSAALTGAFLSYRVASPVAGREMTPQILRLGASADGRIIWSPREGFEGCKPCVIGVGEAIVLKELPSQVPSGMILDTTREAPLLRATAPGRFTVLGLERMSSPANPVHVEVVEQRGPEHPLAPAPALALAESRIAAGETPALPPVNERFPDALLPRRAALALDVALLGSNDVAIARAFLELASADRSALVPLSTVARAAIALRRSADPKTSVRVWRAGLDAAFAAEATSLAHIERHTGPLAVIQKVREAALRYPDGPRVGEALYLLPARLLQIASEGLSPEIISAGIARVDLDLTAVAWDREFLALYRDHELAPVVGLRMSRTLLGLRLSSLAASWAQRAALAHPDDPLIDALLYVRALALTEEGDEPEARRLLERIVDQPFIGVSGAPEPSQHRSEALLVLGRWEEARGNQERAKERYLKAGTDAGQQAADVLSFSGLRAPSIVKLESGKSALQVDAVKVDELSVRIYRVDLRTLFLRDGGLGKATEIGVAGVSPEWSGTRRIAAGPYWGAHEIPLPLDGDGAWIVQLAGERVRSVSLVVRSDLTLSMLPEGDQDRVSVRRNRKPVPGTEIRALDGGTNMIAAVTDERGVALVPRGAAVLAWSGDQWAFTEPSSQTVSSSNTAQEIPPLEGLVDPIDRRLTESRQQDMDRWGEVTRSSAQLSLDAL